MALFLDRSLPFLPLFLGRHERTNLVHYIKPGLFMSLHENEVNDDSE